MEKYTHYFLVSFHGDTASTYTEIKHLSNLKTIPFSILTNHIEQEYKKGFGIICYSVFLNC